ncbi:VIT1/CCC1 family predicted Fe2+/Mn2+ transporter [Novosphingobium sp. 1529]|uniref:VIT1/CCC1 transporter family protein n=1 Tax=Novosphingobium sp. 1529 TaxID=3156424 RepID=UPI003393F522
MTRPTKAERHLIARVGWLRAAVLGANDGILSTASLILGVASAGGTRASILVAAAAALVAGAMSRAAGEYVSVSSQHDTEQADLTRERLELKNDIIGEREELAQIYRDRGIDTATAQTIARELMAKDAVGAHARDELGITPTSIARPIQAALTSAATFSSGAAMPVLIAVVTPLATLIAAEAIRFTPVPSRARRDRWRSRWRQHLARHGTRHVLGHSRPRRYRGHRAPCWNCGLVRINPLQTEANFGARWRGRCATSACVQTIRHRTGQQEGGSRTLGQGHRTCDWGSSRRG